MARPILSPNTRPADGAGFRPIPLVNDPTFYTNAQQKDGTDFPNNAIRTYAFGSAHTGVCNFLIGDGSVHGVSTTASIDVLAYLSSVNDGQAVSIP